MAQYEIEKREHTPVNFLAGDFPTATDVATAKAAIKERTPVTLGDDGKLEAVTSATIEKLTGIAATNAEADEQCVYFLTGEFFASALELPSGVTADAIKETLRNKSIFLR